MEIVVIVVLLAVAACLGLRLYTLYRSIEKAERELREISAELFENRAVKLHTPDGRLEHLLSAVNDNLEVIRLERAAGQKQEKKLKEQIENISHDLRTPLTSMRGYLKMMAAEEMSEENREFLQTAIKKTYTMQSLTEQFYQLTRVTSSDFALKLEAVDASRILKETCLENYPLLEKAGLAVAFPAFDVPVIVKGNQEALSRIFANLIQNSTRYAQSRLAICLMQKPEDETVCFLFTNDISKDQEIPEPERLFERFYMQENSRTHDGTGLGLTIGKTLAEHMGGTMRAEYSGDEAERRLTVTVYLRRISQF